MARPDMVETVKRLVRDVEQDENRMGGLSTGGFLAAVLVLNRHDLIVGNYTMLEAVERLGRDWFEAALQVKREGW